MGRRSCQGDARAAHEGRARGHGGESGMRGEQFRAGRARVAKRVSERPDGRASVECSREGERAAARRERPYERAQSARAGRACGRAGEQALGARGHWVVLAGERARPANERARARSDAGARSPTTGVFSFSRNFFLCNFLFLKYYNS